MLERQASTARLLIAIVLLSGAPLAALGSDDDRRLDFETAKVAFDRDDDGMARLILEGLAETARSEPERLLLRVLTTPEDAARRAELVESATEALRETKTATPTWVEREILVLAATVRFEKLRQAATERLAELLAEHHRALGGLDRVGELRSLAAAGTLFIAQRELPFLLLRTQPGLYRLDLTTPAGVRVEVADAQAAWLSEPARDAGRPRYLPDPESAALRRGSYFFGPLVRHAATGEELLYRGREVVAGKDHHVVEVASPDGSRELALLDASTFLVSRTITLDENGERVIETVTEHREVDGHLLPWRQTVRGPAGTMVFQMGALELNLELDPALFDIETAVGPTAPRHPAASR